MLIGYGTTQRISTTANADSLEFTRNLSGGFLALGMTDVQPGFLVLSAQDSATATVQAEQVSNPVAGTHTRVRVTSATDHWFHRLRGPIVILIDEEGVIQHVRIHWTLSEFQSVRRGVDCSHIGARTVRRCGAPFADLYDIVASWPEERVPALVRSFLARYQR